MSGLTRHYYDGRYWPDVIESCHDEEILSWLESHLCLVPMFPRRPGCTVLEGSDITPQKVKALTEAASRCWDAIMNRDLEDFALAFTDSFNARWLCSRNDAAGGGRTHRHVERQGTGMENARGRRRRASPSRGQRAAGGLDSCKDSTSRVLSSLKLTNNYQQLQWIRIQRYMWRPPGNGGILPS